MSDGTINPRREYHAERRPVGDLQPNKVNSSIFSTSLEAASIGELAESMREYGLRQPIVVRPDGTILDGERRWRAAKSLGWDLVDVHVTVDDVPDERVAQEVLDAFATSRDATIEEQVMVYKLAREELRSAFGRDRGRPPKSSQNCEDYLTAREIYERAAKLARFSSPTTADMAVRIFGEGSADLKKEVNGGARSIHDAYKTLSAANPKKRTAHSNDEDATEPSILDWGSDPTIEVEHEAGDESDGGAELADEAPARATPTDAAIGITKVLPPRAPGKKAAEPRYEEYDIFDGTLDCVPEVDGNEAGVDPVDDYLGPVDSAITETLPESHVAGTGVEEAVAVTTQPEAASIVDSTDAECHSDTGAAASTVTATGCIVGEDGARDLPLGQPVARIPGVLDSEDAARRAIDEIARNAGIPRWWLQGQDAAKSMKDLAVVVDAEVRRWVLVDLPRAEAWVDDLYKRLCDIIDNRNRYLSDREGRV